MPLVKFTLRGAGAMVVGLALAFRSSDNLAAAFGITVSLTMLLTTILIYLTMREVWGWSLPLAIGVAGVFGVVDLAFVGERHQYPIDEADIDLAVAFRGGLGDVQARTQAELDGLAGHRKSAADNGLAGDDRRRGGERHQGHLQGRRAQQEERIWPPAQSSAVLNV
jgi:K+ potassium transporter